MSGRVVAVIVSTASMSNVARRCRESRIPILTMFQTRQRHIRYKGSREWADFDGPDSSFVWHWQVMVRERDLAIIRMMFNAKPGRKHELSQKQGLF